MDAIWKEMYDAAKAVQNGRVISQYVEAGGVAAAILSESGKIYTGVCVDTSCTLGICAERNAIFHMLTCGEQKIARRQDGRALRRLPGNDGAAHARRLSENRNSAGLENGPRGHAGPAHAGVVDLKPSGRTSSRPLPHRLYKPRKGESFCCCRGSGWG